MIWVTFSKERLSVLIFVLLLSVAQGHAATNSYEEASEAYAYNLSGMLGRGEISYEEATRRANEFDARWSADQKQHEQNALTVASTLQVFGNAQQQAQSKRRPGKVVDLQPETYDIYTPGGKNIGTMRKRGIKTIYGN